MGTEPTGAGGAAGAVMADHVAPGNRAYRPRHRRRREALPPLYDGQGVAFADYLMEFRRVADFNGWTEDERCFHMWTSISGPARLKIVSLPYEKSWVKMIEQLNGLFCSSRALDAYRSKWFNSKRGPEMDLESYGLFLVDLSRKANPASSTEEQERFAKERFMETAGSPSMRFWLGALKPSTLQDAIDLAVQYESAYEATRPHKPDLGPIGAVALPVVHPETSELAPTSQSGVAPSAKGDPMTQEQVKELFYSLMNDVLANRGGPSDKGRRDGPRPPSGSNRRCFNCNDYGHIRRDCPKQNRGRDQSGRGNQGNSRPSDKKDWDKGSGARKGAPKGAGNGSQSDKGASSLKE